MDQPSGGATVGRYRIGERLASGGMATVHIARAHAPGGFSRVVAIKRMLPHLAADPAFATMFADEARLAARVRHPNVVPTFDVVIDGGEELCIVMEYVHGVSLAQLLRRVSENGERVPVPVALAIVRDALQGLHAAHEAIDDDGQPLHIVHRDVSPQNVLVGVDGIARVLDFGIAKANVRLLETRTGDALKGKLAYMAPEQLEGGAVTRACDLFAASVVLWEALTGKRLHGGQNEGEIVTKILRAQPAAPSTIVPSLSPALDALVLRGLARAPGDRFATAREMALAIAQVEAIAPAARVAEWLERTAGELLAERATHVRALPETEDVTSAEDAIAAVSERTQSAVAAWSPGPAAPATPTAAPRRRGRTAFALAIGAVVCAAAIAWAATGEVPAAAPPLVVTPVARAPARGDDSAAAPPPRPEATQVDPSATPAPRRTTGPARGRRAQPAIPDHL